MTTASKVSYADIIEEGEYFCQGPHFGFYTSTDLDALVEAAKSGEISGPNGEPIAEIHLNVCDDISRKVWSA